MYGEWVNLVMVSVYGEFLANKGSVFLNIWPVKPFETVHVIKGNTNPFELICARIFITGLPTAAGL